MRTEEEASNLDYKEPLAPSLQNLHSLYPPRPSTVQPAIEIKFPLIPT